MDAYKTAFENVTDVRVDLADTAGAARSLLSACASFHWECTAGGVRSISYFDGVFLFGSCAIVPDDWRADDSTSLLAASWLAALPALSVPSHHPSE